MKQGAPLRALREAFVPGGKTHTSFYCLSREGLALSCFCHARGLLSEGRQSLFRHACSPGTDRHYNNSGAPPLEASDASLNCRWNRRVYAACAADILIWTHHFRRAISARSSVSVVAQLVTKRMMLLFSSTGSQGLKLTVSRSLSFLS